MIRIIIKVEPDKNTSISYRGYERNLASIMNTKIQADMELAQLLCNEKIIFQVTNANSR